jgi:hypothetical protein
MTFPDTDSLNTYGGELVDYAPVIDPTTDRSAAAMNSALASVAGMTHCAPRAICTFTTHATSPVLVNSLAAWGDNSFVVAPTIAHSATGTYTITYPTSYTNELGDTQTISLRYAHGQAISSTRYGVQCEVTSANVVTVYTFNAAGSANDIAGVNVVVFAY